MIAAGRSLYVSGCCIVSQEWLSIFNLQFPVTRNWNARCKWTRPFFGVHGVNPDDSFSSLVRCLFHRAELWLTRCFCDGKSHREALNMVWVIGCVIALDFWPLTNFPLPLYKDFRITVTGSDRN